MSPSQIRTVGLIFGLLLFAAGAGRRTIAVAFTNGRLAGTAIRLGELDWRGGHI